MPSQNVLQAKSARVAELSQMLQNAVSVVIVDIKAPPFLLFTNYTTKRGKSQRKVDIFFYIYDI